MPPPHPLRASDPRTPRWALAVAIAGLVVAIFVLDTVTGHELRLFLLYFLPVSLAAWHLGRVQGLVTAAACAAAWTAADRLAGHEYQVPLHQVWNAAVQFLTFAFVAALLARTSRGLRSERRLNRELVASVARVERLNAGLAKEKDRVESLNAATARDLALAGRVQRAILPPEAPRIPGLDVAVTYRPAIQIGGDLLDICRIDANRTLFLLGDVMGHGVHAALIMSGVSVLSRQIAATRSDPAQLLTELNAAVLTDFPEQLVTGVVCLFDAESSVATLAVAGHPPPLLIRAADGTVEEVGGRGPVLGLMPEARYRPCDVRLAPGDLLVLYTDGLIEAVDRDRSHYGEERLREVLRHVETLTARLVATRLHEDLVAHCDGVPLEDDLALLVLGRPPA